ncbi:MAG: flavodoxin-dependent (E)-4-hydroxy-3-methylbut-2-enyl-diphosphate synthase [Eubacteriaceae bacterium]|nr:flavodoxin-dependent (E)-4-hydroxy-3-methylbut-2-enyl-diphosphate synthase [Eubacteriaceae bacterium]
MKTRVINVGSVKIGGGNPVSVQSMLNVPLTDIERALAQIKSLEEAGCEIIRATVPDKACAEALKIIIPEMKTPMVADIHFDYRMAIASAENGAAKIRINPGNIGGDDKIKEVCACLKANGIPARIGINGGSVEKDILAKYGKVTAEGLVESAARSVEKFEQFGLYDVAVSIKASDVVMTVEANRNFSAKYDNPLHIGITEAGEGTQGIIWGSVGIGTMLMEGIGDTIRVSLTGGTVEEVIAGREILKACGLRKEGIHIVSCPTCGRTTTDTLSIIRKIREKTSKIKKPLTVAVMGCVVNGPGESSNADIGVACSGGKGVIFKGGKIYKTVPDSLVADILLEEIFEMVKEGNV